jgi:hypothetical protein
MNEDILRQLIREVLLTEKLQSVFEKLPTDAYSQRSAELPSEEEEITAQVSSAIGDAADNAEAEFQRWGGSHETDPGMRDTLAAYWSNVGVDAEKYIRKRRPWSAAFISWALQNEPEFKKSAAHSTYMRAAKNARDAGSTSGFVAYKPEELEGGPQRGDIPCRPRGTGNGWNRIGSKNHCDIYVGDNKVIGGNLGDTSKRVGYNPRKYSMVIKKLTESELRDMIHKTLLNEKLKSVFGGGSRESRSSGGSTRARTPSQTSDVEINTGNISSGPTDTDGIKSGVQTTPAILSAWNWLKPFLPAGAVMTSGERDQASQDRVIRNYADRENITYSDLDDAVDQLKDKGFVIARRVSTGSGRGHGTGLAFDISGADLDRIKSSVEFVTRDSAVPVEFNPFKRGDDPSIVERSNNAVHAVIRSVQTYDKGKMMAYAGSQGAATTT